MISAKVVPDGMFRKLVISERLSEFTLDILDPQDLINLGRLLFTEGMKYLKEVNREQNVLKTLGKTYGPGLGRCP